MVDIHTLLQDIAALATAVAVIVAAWQLYMAKNQAQLQFEDGLNQHYRDLLAVLPIAALLGKRLDDDVLTGTLGVFYRYFDLSNEQAFLHKSGRVRPGTWANWLDGIEQNMARPAFQQAWASLFPDLDGSFDELKDIERERARRSSEEVVPPAGPARGQIT